MSLDTLLWFSASVTEAAVIALLLYRRVWRNFPIFFAYSLWTLASSVGVYIISRNLSSSTYLTTYLVEIIVDSTLLFSVLVELAWSLLRPIRASLSRGVLIAITIVIFAIGGAVWPFTIVPGSGGLTRELIVLMRLQQTISVLQIIVFLAFVASTQLLSIGWRDRELQIATGLGFTSLVGLGVTVLHAQASFRLQYNHLSQVFVRVLPVFPGLLDRQFCPKGRRAAGVHPADAKHAAGCCRRGARHPNRFGGFQHPGRTEEIRLVSISPAIHSSS